MHEQKKWSHSKLIWHSQLSLEKNNNFEPKIQSLFHLKCPYWPYSQFCHEDDEDDDDDDDDDDEEDDEDDEDDDDDDDDDGKEGKVNEANTNYLSNIH